MLPMWLGEPLTFQDSHISPAGDEAILHRNVAIGPWSNREVNRWVATVVRVGRLEEQVMAERRLVGWGVA